MFSCKSTFLKKINVQAPFWTELGSILAPKGSQMGGQKGPKRHQKRDQNDINFWIDFWINFGPILEAQEIGWTDFELNWLELT